MSTSTVPQQPILPEPRNPVIDKLVRESVQRFTRELGNFVMIAKANGWIEKYEQEVRRVAEAARRDGVNSGINIGLNPPESCA